MKPLALFGSTVKIALCGRTVKIVRVCVCVCVCVCRAVKMYV